MLFVLLLVAVTFYGGAGIYYAFFNRIHAKNEVLLLLRDDIELNSLHPGLTNTYLEQAASGRTPPQTSSYALSLVLTFSIIIALAGLQTGLFMLYLTLLLVLTPLTIIVNIPWIYSRKMLLAEEYSIATNNEGSNRLKKQRAFAWFAWITHFMLGIVSSSFLLYSLPDFV